jgi:hypothetical protein
MRLTFSLQPTDASSGAGAEFRPTVWARTLTLAAIFAALGCRRVMARNIKAISPNNLCASLLPEPFGRNSKETLQLRN